MNGEAYKEYPFEGTEEKGGAPSISWRQGTCMDRNGEGTRKPRFEGKGDGGIHRGAGIGSFMERNGLGNREKGYFVGTRLGKLWAREKGYFFPEMENIPSKRRFPIHQFIHLSLQKLGRVFLVPWVILHDGMTFVSPPFHFHGGSPFSPGPVLPRCVPLSYFM